LTDYLSFSQGTAIVAQKLSLNSREAGLFYFRKPNESTGTIFSITDKVFPRGTVNHIWDCDTPLLEAYRVLFAQWRILFEIGKQVKISGNNHRKIALIKFLSECFRVIRRNDLFSVSS
jgi:hypothetical protein